MRRATEIGDDGDAELPFEPPRSVPRRAARRAAIVESDDSDSQSSEEDASSDEVSFLLVS